MLEKNDAIIEEKDNSSVSSNEEKTSEEAKSNIREDAKNTDDSELGSGSEKYDSRFKNVYAKLKESERRVEELESKEPPKEEEFEPQTWKDVANYVEKNLTSRQQTEEQRKVEIITKINADIMEIKKVDSLITEDEIWECMDKNEITNPFQAYIKIKENRPLSDDKKKISSKIGSGSQNSSGKSEMTYQQLHKTSLDDLRMD